MIPFSVNSDRLILFTRYPVAGEVKTRLIPALGPEGSCELHRKMTEHTLQQLRIFSAACPEVFEVRYDGGDAALMKQWLGSDLLFLPRAKAIWVFAWNGPFKRPFGPETSGWLSSAPIVRA